ncbi:MAG: GIY-YIG nuclease family protein [Pseudomonadota bacterium]
MDHARVEGGEVVNLSFEWLATLPAFNSAVIPGRREAASPESRATVNCLPYYVYLLASRKNGTLYTGVTRDLVGRTYQHKTKVKLGFTSRYGVTRLVRYEVYDDSIHAITREKELKKWRRAWKIRLIEEMNADWRDLYDEVSR